MTEVVLDASALLALLLGEPGAERVQAVLASAAMSVVNLCEVIGHYARNGATEAQIRRVLQPLPLTVLVFEPEQAYACGVLLASTPRSGLSLGDRACLSLARQLGVKALTADRAWSRIAHICGVEIELIR